MVRLKKKGLQQADWAISIGIFTIYLVVFFIAMKPLLTPPSKIDSLLSRAEDNFLENTTVTVERVPILVAEETDYAYEPVIIDFPYPWDTDDMALSEGYFVLDSDRLLFIANTSGTRSYSIAHSADLDDADPELALISNADQADVEGFKLEFSEGIPSRYTYDGEFRIGSLNIYVDEDAFEHSSSYDDYTSIAKYSGSGVINHTTYLFAKNTRSYSYIESVDYQSHNITLTIDMYNYTEYYASIAEFGDIIYTTERCDEFDTDFIDLTDGNTGAAFFFNKEVEVEICNNETELWLEIVAEVNATEEVSYLIFMHSGDYAQIEEYPVEPVSGFKQQIDSTSYGAVSALAAINYTSLKASWAFPLNHDLRVEFTSDDYNETFGAAHPLVDVYAKHLRLFNYDGVDFEEVNVLITVWGAS
ncbi:hypothetical protein ACFL96_13560 [Thermoproteota archaeon]